MVLFVFWHDLTAIGRIPLSPGDPRYGSKDRTCTLPCDLSARSHSPPLSRPIPYGIVPREGMGPCGTLSRHPPLPPWRLHTCAFAPSFLHEIIASLLLTHLQWLLRPLLKQNGQLPAR